MTHKSRRHDLDALRGFAMLLGILLHAGLAYIPEFNGLWPVYDEQNVPGMGMIISAIHGFRMPLFFMLSGFFTAMLLRRRGLKGLMQHRFKRVFLPLVIGAVTIVPLMWGAIFLASAITTNAQSSTNVETEPQSTNNFVAQPTTIWDAAAKGNLNALQTFIDAGTDLNRSDPVHRLSPLGWTAVTGTAEATQLLIDAGADVDHLLGDNNTALIVASFWGKDEVAKALIEAGADTDIINIHNDTAIDALRHDRATTEWVANLLSYTVDYDKVTAGRDRIRPLLEERNAASAQAELSPLFIAWWLLVVFPLLHHLWFLNALCWLIAGYAAAVLILSALKKTPLRLPINQYTRRSTSQRIARLLLSSPGCLLWLIPLTLLAQAFMDAYRLAPGFGPDTTSGLIPSPPILLYYAVFFGFGSILYTSPWATRRIARGWWIMLALAAILLPIGLGYTYDANDKPYAQTISLFIQAAYPWLMTLGLIGLFQTLLSRERYWVRYLSDSSYWLYLAHLPIIVIGQALLLQLNLPGIVKFSLLCILTTLFLLFSYQYTIRYTPIGHLLNGKRQRPHPV